MGSTEVANCSFSTFHQKNLKTGTPVLLPFSCPYMAKVQTGSLFCEACKQLLSEGEGEDCEFWLPAVSRRLDADCPCLSHGLGVIVMKQDYKILPAKGFAV